MTKTRQHQKKPVDTSREAQARDIQRNKNIKKSKETKQTNANDNKKQPRKKSSGLAGVSSEARLGDGWLVCSVLLLVWPQPKLILSIGPIFTSPKNTPRAPPPPPPQSQAQTQPQAPPKPPNIQKVLSSIPPSPPPLTAAVLVGCWPLAVGRWLLVVGCWFAAVAAVAVVL